MPDQAQGMSKEGGRRGRACLPCRKGKIRCDGARPVCSTCHHLHRVADCTYPDDGRITADMLEGEVVRLEARVHELENRSTGIPLTNPHGAPGTRIDGWQMTNLMNTLQHLTNAPNAMTQVDTETAKILAIVAIQHASQLNFVLDIERFVTLLDLPEANPSYPHPALLNTLFVWALRILNTNTFRDLVRRFLDKAQLALTAALGSGNLFIRLQAIQAEILLAEYFFSLGRSVEGQYHANGAANLTISAGLHQIRPVSVQPGTKSTGRAQGGCSAYLSIPPPRSAREETERIRLFWTVYSLDKSWSVAVGSPSNIIEDGTAGTQIDTPWPPELSANEIGSTSAVPAAERKTVQGFLSGHLSRSDLSDGRVSTLTRRAQVSALLDCVSNTVGYGDAVEAPRSINRISNHSLANLILEFIEALPPLDALARMSPEKRILHLVVRSLGNAANIKLHAPRVSFDHDAQMRFMASARDIVKIAELMASNHINFVDPVIATAWMTVASVLSRREMRNATSKAVAKRLKIALAELAKSCPVLAYQISKIDEFIPLT
ncbi:hypothetical protein BD410DRAFT_843316 [Rickenella mellea]|uniref:Zn(2)-C6 fungal-type domain-containing protein n=1 Tax=Rickenella mellea TaxID=50990 RepID=A0A4Y7PTJ4_9AGAM|nr:hypothetical protein BD410DRAFT_843316 [Rickenella mellea]